VTLHTETHFKLYRLNQAVHLSNVTVAFAAVKTRLNMHLMTEKDKIGQVRNSNPINRNTVIVVFAKSGNHWMMNDYFAVAKHAGLKRRNFGIVGIHSARMAHKTAKFFFGYVDAMTEWNRLLGRCAYRSDRIKNKERANRNGKQYQYQYRKCSGDNSTLSRVRMRQLFIH
jgi:hypothetical protein